MVKNRGEKLHFSSKIGMDALHSPWGTRDFRGRHNLFSNPHPDAPQVRTQVPVCLKGSLGTSMTSWTSISTITSGVDGRNWEVMPILILANFHQNGDFRKILKLVGYRSEDRGIGVVLWVRRILLRTLKKNLSVSDF